MQRSTFLVLAFSCALSSAGFGQAPTPSPQVPTGDQSKASPGASAPSSAAHPESVAPSQDVISLNGVCPPKTGSTAPPPGCVTSVTKEQFEKLTNALKPDLTPDQKRIFAQNYARLLVFNDTALELGLENDPKVQQIFDFAKKNILLQAVNEHYTNEYAHPAQQQIDDYYKQNSKKYAESTLQRIVVPMNNAAATDKAKPTEAEQKAFAEQLRQKWVAGGDPVKLQAEAMDHAGMKSGPPPDVNLGAKRPGSLPVSQESVFDLKQGEVSPLISDPSAIYIYKVVSTRQVPESEVQDSIAQTLSKQMTRDKIESIANSGNPVLNETYFGPTPSGPPAGPGPRGAQPPQGPGPK